MGPDHGNEQNLCKSEYSENHTTVRGYGLQVCRNLAEMSDIVRWCQRASLDNFVSCLSSWLSPDLHKFGPFPKSVLICIILARFWPKFASFRGDLQPWFVSICSTILKLCFLKQTNLDACNKRWKPFCVQKEKTKTYVMRPYEFELSILTGLQYSLNISANISSIFKILYFFQKPTEWAFRKWSLFLLRVL